MSHTRYPSPMAHPLPDRAFAPGWEPRPQLRLGLPGQTNFFDMVAKIRIAEASVLLAMANALVAHLILLAF